ncbi:MAG: hypothetical protein AB7N91_29910 [Candidatus Tectimicrobiota bacterium]
MQRLQFCVGSVLVTLCCLVSLAAGQSERFFLVGGNYRIQTTLHNMQDGFFGAPPVSEDNEADIFLDTRLRLYFDIRPSQYLLINYKMEVGDVTFGAANPPVVDADGRRLPNVGRGSGGAPGSDGVNVETKNAYIDIRVPWLEGLSFRGGIIGWGDQFDWTILATDFTGLQVTYQRQALWTQLTFLQLVEGSLRSHADDSYWYALDTRLGLSSKTSLAGSIYVWDDNDNDNPRTGHDAFQLYAGLKLNTVLFEKGLLEVSGVYNTGQEFLGQAVRSEVGSGVDRVSRYGLRGSKNQGFMANVHFDYPIGKHWVGATLQYIAGEKGSRTDLDGSGKDINAFLSLFNSQYSGFGQSRYTEGGGLQLLTLSQMNDSTAGLNNIYISPYFGGSYNGRILAMARAKIYATPVLSFYLASGWDQAARPNVNGDRGRGVEFSSYMHWDIVPKLWLRVGGAYMLTMSWWKNNPDVRLQGFPNPVGLRSGDPENIFQLMLRLQYNFG